MKILYRNERQTPLSGNFIYNLSYLTYDVPVYSLYKLSHISYANGTYIKQPL